MTILAENKRRVLAGIATLAVLMALGFALGRATNGPPAADAASRSAPSKRVPVAAGHRAAISTLSRKLDKVQKARSVSARHLASAQAANRQLRHAAVSADRVNTRTRRCQHIRAPQRFRRCVTVALSR